MCKFVEVLPQTLQTLYFLNLQGNPDRRSCLPKHAKKKDIKGLFTLVLVFNSLLVMTMGQMTLQM